MHFVNNIDLEARRRRCVAHIFDNLTNIANAGARGGVHFNHINMGTIHNGFTMRAGLSEVDARRVHPVAGVIQCARENARRRRLADTAHAGQHKGMGDAPCLKSIGQGSHHGFLTDQIVEIAGPVFARQHFVISARLHIVLRVRLGQHVKARRIGINHRCAVACFVFRRLVFVLRHKIGDSSYGRPSAVFFVWACSFWHRVGDWTGNPHRTR